MARPPGAGPVQERVLSRSMPRLKGATNALLPYSTKQHNDRVQTACTRSARINDIRQCGLPATPPPAIKNPHQYFIVIGGGSLTGFCYWLGGLDIGSLLSLGTLHDFEGNLLAFFQGLESAHVNRGEMRKQVFAPVIRSDETKAFSVVEPLNCTSCHV